MRYLLPLVLLPILVACQAHEVGCSIDTDCKGDRVCDQETLRCAEPAPGADLAMPSADMTAPRPDLACPGAGGPCSLCGCPTGQMCWDGACVDPLTSNQHCGGYRELCTGKGLQCCNGGCVWIEKDPKNCGRCGNQCLGSMGYPPVCCPSPMGAYPGECKPVRTICP